MKEMVYYPERLEHPMVLFDEPSEDKKYRIIGLNLGTHPTAYVGIPIDSILTGLSDYGILNYVIDVHGGFTYSAKGDDTYLPSGYWWFGWDYAHLGDYVGYYEDDYKSYRWTTKEIYKEAKNTLDKIMSLELFCEAFLQDKITKLVRNLLKDDRLFK